MFYNSVNYSFIVLTSHNMICAGEFQYYQVLLKIIFLSEEAIKTRYV